MGEEGGAVKRWVLEGTDYVYPRTTNKILEAFLKSKGVAAERHQDQLHAVRPLRLADRGRGIKNFASAGKKTAVVSTINGDANVPFYKELANAGIKASDIPVVAFSVGEEELAGIDTKNLVGHLAAWNYFQSVKNADQRRLHQAVARLHQEPEARHQRPDGSALHRLQDVGAGGPAGRHHRCRRGAAGDVRPEGQGALRLHAVMNTNHHLSKPVMIGEIQADGQFDVVWQTKEAIKADAWSPYLPEDKGKVADWTYPWVCGNCTAPKYARLTTESRSLRCSALSSSASRRGLRVAASCRK